MSNQDRISLLHDIAKRYVVDGLGAKNFDAIPYHEDISLRAPLNHGGSDQPIVGREQVRNTWWAPLPQLVVGTTLLDSFVNREASAVSVEFYCEIAKPSCTLRIIDRFVIDDQGKITGQENFFDPRDVTNPGWREA